MMESVTYVGDKKQSIYGFRGTDLSVVESVTNEFPEQLYVVDENGNMITTLKKSWRSTKTLVDFTNQIFERAFEGEIAPELVRLEKADGGNGDADEKPEHWWFDVGNNDLFYKELALKVNSLIKERGLKAKDVAILFRKIMIVSKWLPCSEDWDCRSTHRRIRRVRKIVLGHIHL